MTTAAIVGPFGPAQLACLRSWRSLGLRTVFVHLSDGSRDVPLVRSLVDVYLRLPGDGLDRPAGQAAFFAALRREGSHGVTALSYALIARLHELSSDAGWPPGLGVWATPRHTLPFLNSKQDQIDRAAACGLDVAALWRIDAASRRDPPDFAYPVVVRPDGAGAVVPDFKVEYIASADAMRTFLAALDDLPGALLVQPFVAGKNIVVHGARSPLTGEIVHAAFEVDDMLDGVTLSLRACEVPVPLLDGCAAFAAGAGLEGVYHFEFRRSAADGRFYFLEVNGRLGGTTGKALRLGFDEPALLVHAFRGDPLAAGRPDAGAAASNRQAIVKACLRTLRGRLTIFDYPAESTPRRLISLFVGFWRWRDEIYHWRHWRSGLAYLMHQLARSGR